MRLFCAALFCLFACHDHEHDNYGNFQECYLQHFGGTEGLTQDQAIVVCCLDHTIDGEMPACGDSAQECQTYLSLHLETVTDVTTACDEYIRQKGM